MKAFWWILGGSAIVSGGVWYWLHYNSPEQRRLRSLAGPGGNSVVAASHQEAPAGVSPTIFHEPNLEPVSVDLSMLGVLPPL